MMLGDRKRRDGYEEVKEASERVRGEQPGFVSGGGGSSEVHAGIVFWVPPRFECDGTQATSGIGSDGLEYPDSTPQAIDTGLKPGFDIYQQLNAMVRSERLRENADREGFDTPEEAMDLEMPGEEPWPESDYEEHFLPEDPPHPSRPQPPVTGGEENKPSAKAPSPPSLSPDKLKDDGGPGAKPPTADEHSTHIT